MHCGGIQCVIPSKAENTKRNSVFVKGNVLIQTNSKYENCVLKPLGATLSDGFGLLLTISLPFFGRLLRLLLFVICWMAFIVLICFYKELWSLVLGKHDLTILFKSLSNKTICMLCAALHILPFISKTGENLRAIPH